MSTLSARAGELSERLARQCAGRLPPLPAQPVAAKGRYWMVGDVAGAPGRSLYVRLFETERGRIGNWVDAATGEHGDLVDLIRLNQRHGRLSETIDEAEKFLSLPPSVEADPCRLANRPPTPVGSPTAARRLFAASKPLAGTLAATYLAARGITRIGELAALRFHPQCYYRANEDDLTGTPGSFPALIAAVTDCDGVQTGTHRTWLDPSGSAKADCRIAATRDGQYPRACDPVWPWLRTSWSQVKASKPSYRCVR